MKLSTALLLSAVSAEFQMGDDDEAEVVEDKLKMESIKMSDFNADDYLDNMGSSGTIDFKTPELNTEEGGEQNMPFKHRCDACRIIGIKMHEAFDKKVNLYPSVRDGKKELTESQILDLLEDVCDNLKTWESVGSKTINGIPRLSAPGFETEQVPGITQGGMKWPWRFKTHCNHLLEEMGEEEIYALYRGKDARLIYDMCYDGAKKDCVRYPTPAVPKLKNDEYARDEL